MVAAGGIGSVPALPASGDRQLQFISSYAQGGNAAINLRGAVPDSASC
jgi:hypothetical protein